MLCSMHLISAYILKLWIVLKHHSAHQRILYALQNQTWRTSFLLFLAISVCKYTHHLLIPVSLPCLLCCPCQRTLFLSCFYPFASHLQPNHFPSMCLTPTLPADVLMLACCLPNIQHSARLQNIFKKQEVKG